jgi:hypothetical protein
MRRLHLAVAQRARRVIHDENYARRKTLDENGSIGDPA